MRNNEVTLTVSRIAETRSNILSSQIWKIIENLLLGHTRCQVGKNVVHRDAHATDTRLPASLTRFNRNNVLVSHTMSIDR